MSKDFSEYLVNAHESLVGELLGRLLDTDAKLRMASDRVKGLLEQNQELLKFKAELQTAEKKIADMDEELNALALANQDLQVRNSELSIERQASLEANMETIRSEQENVEHNQAEAE